MLISQVITDEKARFVNAFWNCFNLSRLSVSCTAFQFLVLDLTFSFVDLHIRDELSNPDLMEITVMVQLATIKMNYLNEMGNKFCSLLQRLQPGKMTLLCPQGHTLIGELWGLLPQETEMLMANQR